MTTALDSTFGALAVSLLNSYGAAAQFIVRGLTPTPATSGVSEVDVDPIAVKILPPQVEKTLAGGNVLAERATTLVASSGIGTPVPGACYLTFDGSNWSVDKVRAIWSGDAIAAYELEISRA